MGSPAHGLILHGLTLRRNIFLTSRWWPVWLFKAPSILVEAIKPDTEIHLWGAEVLLFSPGGHTHSGTHPIQPQGVQHQWRHPLTHTYGSRKPKFSSPWGNAPFESSEGGESPLKIFLLYHSLTLSLTHSFIAFHLGFTVMVVSDIGVYCMEHIMFLKIAVFYFIYIIFKVR